MSRWNTAPLAEMCETITVGHVGSMASQYVEDGIPFLRSQNVRRGRLDMTGLKFIPEQFHQQLRKSQLRPGDVVIVRTGEPGAAALVPASAGEVNCSDLVIARPAHGVDPRFLCYAINATSAQYVAAHLVGAVQQHFNVGSARNMRLPAPSLSDQRAVAAVLGALDDKITVNERIAESTRQFGVSLFTQAVDAKCEHIRITALAQVVSRGVTPRYTEDASELLVLNQKCIRAGRVSAAPARRTLAAKVQSAKRLQPNDILVNSTGVGTLGRVARWTGVLDATVDSHVTIVRFDASKVNLLCAGFAMLAAQPEFERLGEGSTGQTELSRTKLGDFSLRLPPSETQETLGAALGALESRGEAALAESIALGNLRDTLLPGLVSGAIRVRDAEKAVEDAT